METKIYKEKIIEKQIQRQRYVLCSDKDIEIKIYEKQVQRQRFRL